MDTADTPVLRLEVEEDGATSGTRAIDAASDLHDELRKYLPQEAVPSAEGDGAKGDPVTLLSIAVVLVSSGLVTEMIRCVRDWLGRRPDKRKLVVRDGDGSIIVTLDAENVGDDAVATAIAAAVRRGRAG